MPSGEGAHRERCASETLVFLSTLDLSSGLGLCSGLDSCSGSESCNVLVLGKGLDRLDSIQIFSLRALVSGV